ncbi:hypothetical protein WD026_15065 [Hydrogenophaga sp. R2]
MTISKSQRVSFDDESIVDHVLDPLDRATHAALFCIPEILPPDDGRRPQMLIELIPDNSREAVRIDAHLKAVEGFVSFADMGGWIGFQGELPAKLVKSNLGESFDVCQGTDLWISGTRSGGVGEHHLSESDLLAKTGVLDPSCCGTLASSRFFDATMGRLLAQFFHNRLPGRTGSLDGLFDRFLGLLGLLRQIRNLVRLLAHKLRVRLLFLGVVTFGRHWYLL